MLLGEQWSLRNLLLRSKRPPPHPNDSLWLPRFKSVRLIKTFSSVLTVVLFWPLSSPHVWKCPVKIKTRKRRGHPETDEEKKHTRQFSRVLQLGNERHKFPISTAKHKHLRDCPVEQKSGQASWLTVGSTMARDTNPQTPQTRECQWPADSKEPSDETEEPLRSSLHPNSQGLANRAGVDQHSGKGQVWITGQRRGSLHPL